MKKNVVNAVGIKTTRPCEDCRRRRACWYCIADDAFLCNSCDSLVHSANPFARRHDRVRLKTFSSNSVKTTIEEYSLPSWHSGFTRKARSARRPSQHQLSEADKFDRMGQEPNSSSMNSFLVPELGDDLLGETEEQHLYRVPEFESATLNGLCVPETTTTTATSSMFNDHKPSTPDSNETDLNCALADIPCYFPSDGELADFDADVQYLLGSNLDDDTIRMEGLGFLDTREAKLDFCHNKVKMEEEDEMQQKGRIDKDKIMVDTSSDTTDLSTLKTEEGEEKIPARSGGSEGGSCHRCVTTTILRLNYDAVITAWAAHGSPWTTPDPPPLDPDDCWYRFMGMRTRLGERSSNTEACVGLEQTANIRDGWREARVSRYREKRRTRLFSKKIRYEVRKLNAEKRPRVNGRFVNRTSFAVPIFPC